MIILKVYNYLQRKHFIIQLIESRLISNEGFSLAFVSNILDRNQHTISLYENVLNNSKGELLFYVSKDYFIAKII